ncbi:hypothetical protein RU92_GL001560 [Lactococcus cremoris subsp. tructae]|uniref:Uncharacterized protein n=1 Tax=Lactococcus cremoris subsp. tructae TaxID=542833 RepID=A0A2A5SVW4_LACLC|nr:hypothetical protein RU92_GL001560 [Lactococcus cremoris subsp. tructae]
MAFTFYLCPQFFNIKITDRNEKLLTKLPSVTFYPPIQHSLWSC